MTPSKLPVILYHYDPSPFATKVKSMLILKRIAHKRVNVAMTLPRPEITDLLGITYRRIPILAIGNDVYCDTSLIASVLERRFPASEGYGTLYPSRTGTQKADTGLAKALVLYWNDKVLFPLGGNSLDYGRFDPAFVADRSQWSGVTIDPKRLSATQGPRTSALSSHLALLEEQLSDGRHWLLDTEKPGLADIGIQFFFAWLQRFKTIKDIYDPAVVPKTLEWLARTAEYLAQQENNGAATFEKLSGEEAAKIIVSAPHEDENVIGFLEAEGNRLGVKLGDTVSVMPLDTGKIPTYGRLVSLNREEVAIEVIGSAGRVRVHFPRLEYSLKAGGPASSKF
ncbi:hypothetical protein BC835DRAFT_1326554 [Cytidiella melzeri]|nr:hypothetical protein BC835DRAFT_1326554 [Cytidiella melzeri]